MYLKQNNHFPQFCFFFFIQVYMRRDIKTVLHCINLYVLVIKVNFKIYYYYMI